ncbi:MAG: hypothetical protein H0V44_17870 [Planctomycetes bacterium]|nr:hypothetical protein [Planctomycetota bacterium]
MTDTPASTSTPRDHESAAATRHYAELRASLARVRWALKRAAAVRGLAVVVIEGVGMLLVVALLDHLYLMPQTLRIGILAVVAATIAVLLVRHVLRELLRPIPDDRIALYIEERQQGAGGALLAATTFGRTAAEDHGAVYRSIVGSIVATAASQAGGLRLSRVLDLARLRKYVLTAIVLLCFCAVSAFKFSTSRVQRLLMPWQASKEDLASTSSASEERKAIEFRIVIDPQDHRVARGSSLRVKATLSGATSTDVSLRFRSSGSTGYKTLAMDQIDELDTFAVRLPDITADLEFFIQCGGQVSEAVAVAAYDPLEMKGYQVTVEPPAYVGGKPSVAFGRSADVSALIGSRVILRALANTPLAGGEIVFSDGRRLALAGESGPEHAAQAAFTIEKDESFTVAIASVDQQSLGAGSAFTVHAITDRPPTVSVLAPNSDVAVHPAAEIEFNVRAGDDVGLDHVDLVYNNGRGDITPQRLRFALAQAQRGPGDHQVGLVLALADLKQRLSAGDSLFYHVEAVDRKGQERISDIFMLKLRPYEVAGAFSRGGAHEAHKHPANLMLFIAAVWNIHAGKGRVSRADHDASCDALAAKMTDAGGAPLKFAKPKAAQLPPDKAELVKQGDECIVRGIAALKAHDAAASVAELRQALALYQSAGVGLDFMDQATSKEIGGVQGAGDDPMADALGFLKMEMPTPEFDAPPPNESPDFRRAVKPDDAKKLREEARELEKKQEQIVAEVKKLATVAGAAQPDQEQPPKGDGKTAGAEKPEPETRKDDEPRGDAAETADVQERTAQLGRDQQDLADQAARLAQQLAKGTPNPDQDAREVLDHLRQTHEEMAAAADKIRTGALQEAAAHGEEARRELDKAAETLDISQFTDLQQTVEAAEDRAQRIVELQKRIHSAMDQVVAGAAKREPQGETPGKAPALTAQEVERIRGLAKLQVENQQAAEELQAFVQQVAKQAAGSDKAEAGEELAKAAKTMEQGKVGEAMVTAAVALAQHEFAEADEAHDGLDKTLDKLTRHLQAANGAMAQNREQKLKRANAEIKELIAKAADLGGLDPEGEPAATPAAPDTAKTGAPDAKPPAAGQDDGQKTDGKQTDAKKPDRTAAEERQARDDLRRSTARLAKRLAEDQLTDPAAQAQLQRAADDEQAFRDLFSKEHPEKVGTFIATLKSVSSQLEGKLESALKAKRLSASQREQTPASYRAMVNSYYEQLAKE